MKKVLFIMKPFITEIKHDFMLVACIVGPMFVGAIFKFLLPVLENVLCDYFSMEYILSPYYDVFDMILVVMTPIMLCFAGVMVILEEVDNGVMKYYAVTPVGRGGYLCSRLVIPVVVAVIYDVLLLLLFTSSHMELVMILALSVSGGLFANITSILVIAFAKNKMEGMALIKLCGILIIGIPASYFISGPVRYLFGVLPSFWMAELLELRNIWMFAMVLITSGAWVGLLYGKFRRKLL